MDEKLLISRPIIENGDYGLSDESQRSIALYLFETYIFFKEVNIFGTFEEIRNGCNQLPIEKRKTFLQETIKYMDEIISHAGGEILLSKCSKIFVAVPWEEYDYNYIKDFLSSYEKTKQLLDFTEM